MDDRADHHRRNRKTRDRALVLLIAGLALLMPPLAGIFEMDAKLAGVPVTLIYLFAIWAVMIAGAAALSRQLRDSDESPPETEP